MTDDRPPATRGRPAGDRPPRNYLARAEQRRIFWLFMPPAIVMMLVLGWLERTWFAAPGRPGPRQVDTRLAATDAVVADAVTIHPEGPTPEGSPEEFGASQRSLALVRDDTTFRAADEDAWFQIWAKLRETEQAALLALPARRVGFTELYGQPLSFRGRLVRFRGTLHRLERLDAPPNNYDVREYWQGWLGPAGGPPSPIVVYFLKLPEGMPAGLKIHEDVDVVGYFFKRWAYAATDSVRTAPLVLAIEPIWQPRPSGPVNTGAIGTVALVTMAGLVLLTALGIAAAGRGGSRPPEPRPEGLTAALSDVELFSPEESLRRLAESQRDAPPTPPEPEP